jgi:hypothetical protein
MAQTYQTHRQRTPLYLYGVLLPFMLNLVWTFWRFVRNATLESAVPLMMGLAFVVMWWQVRRMVLVVQNRVIRLEMRLRLREILPAAMHADISRLTVSQLVALRFASDAELPDLTREVLSGRTARNDEIKRKIRDWQGDHLRA